MLLSVRILRLLLYLSLRRWQNGFVQELGGAENMPCVEKGFSLLREPV